MDSTYKLYGNGTIKYEKLSSDEQNKLLMQYSLGDKSVEEKLIESNLGMVAYVVNKYFYGMSDDVKEDLFQVGCLALQKLLKKYDINKGNAFSTYAIPMIYGEMRIYIRNDKPIKYSRKIKNVISRIIALNLDDLSVSEISERINEPEDIILDALTLLNVPISIDASINNETKNVVGDIIPGNSNIELEYEKKEEIDELRKMFKFFSERDCAIVKLYYGIDCAQKTQDEISKMMNLSQANISRIVKRIPRQMKRIYDDNLDLDSTYINKSFEEEFNVYNDKRLYTALEGLCVGEQNIICDAYGIARPRLSLIEIAEKYHMTSALEAYSSILRIKGKIFDYLVAIGLLNQDEKSKVTSFNEQNMKRNRKMKKELDIFAEFSEYSAEEVLQAIGKLKEKYRKIIEMRYGINGEEQKSLEQIQLFLNYSSLNATSQIISKIKVKLRVKLKEQRKLNVSNVQEVPEGEELMKKEPESKITEPVSIEKNSDMSKEDCIKMLELLRTPKFAQMMSTLTVKEAIIIALKLGYIDGKYFSTSSIAQFLGIKEEEIIEITKKVLLLYKDNINSFLDKTIEVATAGK